MARLCRLRRDERGLSQSVQYAVLTPTLLLVTLGIVQAGVWIHGHNVALQAANAAIDVARGSYGRPGEAHDLAGKLAAAGGLRDVRVAVSRGSAEVKITVSAQAPLIFGAELGRIVETAHAPLERVTGP